MGGKSSVVNPLGKNFLGTGGTVLNRPVSGLATGGLSEFTQKNPFGVPVNNPLASVFGNAFDPGRAVPGPFTLDPNQVAADQNDINSVGKNQYSDTLAAIDANDAAQGKRAGDLFKSMLPDIAENAQAAHLYDSTGYGDAVGNAQAEIISKLTADSADKRLAALSGRQGFETGALQRGQSLEDFINSANVAKTIGAQMAPQPPSGKQNFGTVASGVGALAPWGKVFAGTPAPGGK